MLRFLFPLILGLGGAAILVSLGMWQMQRLDWKLGVLARIEAQMNAPPRPLPAAASPQTDTYLPVALSGQFEGGALDVLVSRKQVGPGYRRVAAFTTADGRRILIDRGFLREQDRLAAQPEGTIEIIGNLHWPQEIDRYTPPPDVRSGIWFARDVPAMAQALGTEPLLVIQRSAMPSDPVVYPMPLDTAHIPNDHLQYAGTWFLLATAWLGMTSLLLWRIWRTKA